MQRTYSREEYLEKIAMIHRANKPIAITTDIIVGFPGETECDFEETISLLEEVQYAGLFAFKYSTRPNRTSLAMNDAIPEEEKGRRLAVVQEKQREIQAAGNAELAGQTFEVLVSGKSRRENHWTGYTTSHRMINFSSQERKLLRPYVQVLVTGGGQNSLLGEHT